MGSSTLTKFQRRAIYLPKTDRIVFQPSFLRYVVKLPGGSIGKYFSSPMDSSCQLAGANGRERFLKVPIKKKKHSSFMLVMLMDCFRKNAFFV